MNGKSIALAAAPLAALIVWQTIPPPAGLTASNWPLLLIFATTLFVIIVHPRAIGTAVLVALAAGSLLRIFPIEQALSGFSNNVLWLIMVAFMFSRAFIKTGLGRRIALHIIRRLSRSSLQLGYSLALTDLVLAPVTASNTARVGAIIFPIASSLAREFASEPERSARRIGSFLLFTAFQSNLVTSAMFLTAMAANPLVAEFTLQMTGVQITWFGWLLGSCVPGVVGLVAVPYFIYKVYPPELKETPEARHYAAAELEKLGPTSRKEKLLVLVFTVLAFVWASAQLHGIETVTSGLAALCILLLSGTLLWEDVIGEKRAWGTLLWWGGMLSLASMLNKAGITSWFAELVGRAFTGLAPMLALILLLAVYLYVHYVFAGQTAHVVALFSPFLAVAVAAGAPPLLAALMLGYFSNLNASLTHYGDGAAPIYYGSGYIELKDWWRVGFLLSLLNLAIWLGIGIPWGRMIGIW